MYLYWNGFEIDGSDTDFDLVLPQLGEEKEFVQHFLSVPLFGDSEPDFYRRGTRLNDFKTVHLSRDKFMELLEKPDRPPLCIDVNCRVMDELPEEVCRSLYALSEVREPRETACGKVENPCMAPCRQKEFHRGDMTVSLSIEPPGTKKEWYTNEDVELEGYINNVPLLCSSDSDYPCLSINVGPGYYFEYAMYLIQYLQDAFPGLATAGGLDCGGGWTFGCTYASSIYAYEKIRLPIRYSVRNTLKRLAEYDILSSYRQYYKKNWHFERLGGFCLVNGEDGESAELSLSQYEALIETVLNSPCTPVDAVCKTAVKILLPEPERFRKTPKIETLLRKAIKEPQEQDGLWYFTGFAAFLRENGQDYCEFRVPWRLKDYFFALMELIEQEQIEYIKTETYQRRHKNDHQA